MICVGNCLLGEKKFSKFGCENEEILKKEYNIN